MKSCLLRCFLLTTATSWQNWPHSQPQVTFPVRYNCVCYWWVRFDRIMQSCPSQTFRMGAEGAWFIMQCCFNREWNINNSSNVCKFPARLSSNLPVQNGILARCFNSCSFSSSIISNTHAGMITRNRERCVSVLFTDSARICKQHVTKAKTVVKLHSDMKHLHNLPSIKPQ